MPVVCKRSVNHVRWVIEGTDTVSMKEGGAAAVLCYSNDDKAMPIPSVTRPCIVLQAFLGPMPPVTHCSQIPSISSRLCCSSLTSRPSSLAMASSSILCYRESRILRAYLSGLAGQFPRVQEFLLYMRLCSRSTNVHHPLILNTNDPLHSCRPHV